MTRLTPAVLVFLLLACGDARPGSGDRATAPLDPSTRDSAGVTIHEHPADALDRAVGFVADTAPMAALWQDADDDFSRVLHVRFLADGRVALYDGLLGAVRVFGADGAAQGSFGRLGEGPGEFQYVSGVALVAGDTIALHDPGSSRVTLVHPDTGVVRSFAVPPMGMFVSYALITRGPDGWYFAPTMYAVNGPPDLATDGRRPVVPVALVAETAGVSGSWDTVATTLGLELIRHRMEMMGQSREMSTPKHFAPEAVITAWVDGTVLVSDNERWNVRLLRGRGVPEVAVRIDRPNRPSSAATLDSLTAAQRRKASGSPQATPEMVEAYLNAERAKPMVDSLPPFAEAYPTPGDLIWLAEYLAPGDSASRYTAIDREGRIVGRLQLPAGSRVMAFGTDRVLLATEDADGVVHLAVHRVSAEVQ